MQTLTLPDLYCPFPVQINPHCEALRDYALEWVVRFKLVENDTLFQRFKKAKFYLLAAGAYPHCALEELKIANDVISWLFIWDDLCDVSDLGRKTELLKKFSNRFLEILNGAELTCDDLPLAFALKDIRNRIIHRRNITFFHHLVRNFEDYFHGCIEEAKNRVNLIVPDVNTYIKIRGANAAAALCLNLIEFCDRVTISYGVRNHQIIQQVTQMTINILGWSNDIFSVHREMANGEVHNLVLVLYHQYGCSLEEALQKAVLMHNQAVRKLLQLEAKIPTYGAEVDGDIAKYISGLHSWIRGNFDWYARSGRYQIEQQSELFKHLQPV